MKNKWQGALCLSLAAAIWGGLFLAVRMVVGSIEAVPLVWLRYVLAIITVYLLGCCKGVSWKIQPKDYKLVILTGLIGQTLSIVTQESGTLLTSAQTGSTITAATPAFMVLFGWLILKEKLSLSKVLAVALATIGVLCIVYDPDNFQMNIIGGFYLFVAALTWALMAVFLKLLKHYSPIVLTFYGILVAVITLAPYSLWWLTNQGDINLLCQQKVLLSIAYMGIISTTGGFVLWNQGLLHMEAATAGLFMFIQPVVGTFLGWLLLGESLTILFWIGALLIVAGVLITMLPSRSSS